MISPEATELWQRLRSAEIVTEDHPPAPTERSLWYVRAVLGVAGWIGAVCLVIFCAITLSSLLESAGTAFVVGVVACFVGWLLFQKPKNSFASQFGLAISMAGQILVLIALATTYDHAPEAVAMGMALFQTVLFFTLPNFVHRVWAAWIAGCALSFALAHGHMPAYGPGLISLVIAAIWLHEFSITRHAALRRAGGYGLILALISAQAWALLSRESISEGGIQSWTGAALGGLALLWTTGHLLRRERLPMSSTSARSLLAIAIVLALASLKAPGLAPAALILVLGFAGGNRSIFGLGVIALLAYLAHFYYSLESTLLYKSILMMGTGLILLAARVALQRGWPETQREETPHA